MPMNGWRLAGQYPNSMRTKGDHMDAALRLERLKERVDHAEYRVDEEKVADAIIRRWLFISPETGGGSPRGPAPPAHA